MSSVPETNSANAPTDQTRFFYPVGMRAEVRKKISIPIFGGQGTFVTYRGLGDSGEHISILLGPQSSHPLVRVHSECLTGDVFGSGKCDCGEQLREAVETIRTHGGVLVYLRQEGRGIGLYNKLDAYELQAQGMDTYEANQALGFRDDLRNYKVAAEMLRALGIESVRLLTNNPDKGAQLEAAGIQVSELVPTGVFVKKDNLKYLEAKIRKTGHRIGLPAIESESP